MRPGSSGPVYSEKHSFTSSGRPSIGAEAINREEGQRRAVVMSNVRDRDFGQLRRLSAFETFRELRLPPGYFVEFGGQFEKPGARHAASDARHTCRRRAHFRFALCDVWFRGAISPRDDECPFRIRGWYRCALAAPDELESIRIGRLHRTLWRRCAERYRSAKFRQSALWFRPHRS